MEEPEEGETHQQPEKRVKLDNTQNAETKQRTKRMFGQLLGTLNKFKEQTATKTEAQIRREEFERSLSEKLAKEKAELAVKVATENEERRKLRDEQRKKEEETKRVQLMELQRRNKSHLSNYVKTTASPPIYYLPAKMSDAVQEVLTAQKREVALESTRDLKDGMNGTHDGDGDELVDLDVKVGGLETGELGVRDDDGMDM
ncbi:hypothetical protein M427DRAFT_51678 [Gonapodya prolifera JEL478]|uniref:Pinin/SDK/MemA protein domain-containing protein n=1 Tax=Gonapodya prolifera (strain JEL478) TaxID=1344416 RepID=A0A139AVF3_GONPJ|nr:hypothetical protein M427DRAFT_51678 [Gonapodya prolifera JEL478]|eukprot:KXS20697.1 hypothetical protein M427DRAFT_51678 [Gonapodya prolifera JEL478]